MPEEEMWIKIGGDMGGGTFKMCFQLCNVENPNSPQNTSVFSIFEAPDTYSNLWIALQHFKEQIPNIETHTWRYCLLYLYSCTNIHTTNRGKNMRVFLCGDYQFLCHMFGTSGASGVYTVYYNYLDKTSYLRSSLLLVVSYTIRPTEDSTSSAWSSSTPHNSVNGT